MKLQKFEKLVDTFINIAEKYNGVYKVNFYVDESCNEKWVRITLNHVNNHYFSTAILSQIGIKENNIMTDYINGAYCLIGNIRIIPKIYQEN